MDDDSSSSGGIEEHPTSDDIVAVESDRAAPSSSGATLRPGNAGARPRVLSGAFEIAKIRAAVFGDKGGPGGSTGSSRGLGHADGEESVETDRKNDAADGGDTPPKDEEEGEGKTSAAGAAGDAAAAPSQPPPVPTKLPPPFPTAPDAAEHAEVDGKEASTAPAAHGDAAMSQRIDLLESQVQLLVNLLEDEVTRNDANARRLAMVQREVYGGSGYVTGWRGRESISPAEMDGVPVHTDADARRDVRSRLSRLQGGGGAANDRSRSAVVPQRGASVLGDPRSVSVLVPGTSSSSSSSSRHSSSAAAGDAGGGASPYHQDGAAGSDAASGGTGAGAGAAAAAAASAGAGAGAEDRGAGASADGPRPDFQGWLHKEGRVRKTWKRRWFVLYGSNLTYFKAKPVTGAENPKGTISLATCALETATIGGIDSANPKKKAIDCLVLITSGRKLYFHGDGAEDTGRWVVAIRNAMACTTYVKKCKMTGSAPDARVLSFFDARNCTSLDLAGGSKLSLEGLVALTEPIASHSTLVRLDLSRCAFADVDVGVLCGALGPNGSVLVVSLSGNEIGPAGAKDIGKLLRENTVIEELLLDGNHIGDEGMEHLTPAIPAHRTLVTLDVSRNDIGDDGACSLCNALCTKDKFEGWPQMPVLCLEGNKISDRGCSALSAVISVNSSVRALRLQKNNISDVGVKSLCDGLRYNRAVQEIELRGNPSITRDGYRMLLEVLRWNKNLTVIDIGDNIIQGSGLAALRVLWNTGLIGDDDTNKAKN